MEGMSAIFAAVAIAAPLTVALVQAVKASLKPSSVDQTRLAPALSVASGVGIVCLLVVSDIIDVSWGAALLTGLITGLTASGFYSGTKTVLT